MSSRLKESKHRREEESKEERMTAHGRMIWKDESEQQGQQGQEIKLVFKIKTNILKYVKTCKLCLTNYNFQDVNIIYLSLF